MRRCSRRVPRYSRRSGLLRSVASVVVATMFVVSAALHGATQADSQQYSVVARVDARNAGLTPRDIVVRVENVSVPATAIEASPDIPRNIAIVMDAGPDQAKVLSKEKDLAIALINELADTGTSFTIASASTSSKIAATTLDRSVAIEQIREITGDSGEKTNVPIYDAIRSAIRQLSLAPGLRVVIFLGEGNDGGSKMRYAELRGLAESNHIACFASLVADHSLRGAKSVLRYGWNLRELAGDTAGLFLENQKAPEAVRRLSESVGGLRLVTFKMPSLQSGRSKISVLSPRDKGLRAQKAIVTP
jgi:hypothetical protein